MLSQKPWRFGLTFLSLLISLGILLIMSTFDDKPHDVEEALYNVAKEELSEISIDLVTRQYGFPALERLFSVEAGEWLDLESLFGYDENTTNRIQRLRKLKALRGPVDVTWLDYYSSSDEQEFCLILFYCQVPLWSHNILCNKTYFTEKITEMKATKPEKKAVFS